MKYWRGYLVAAILGVITWALTQMADRYSVLVDMVYPYLTRTVQSFLASWTGGVDFCVWQVALVLMLVVVLATIVLMIVLRWNFVQWLGWVLTGAVLVGFLHTGVYGLNYYAGPLADDIRLELSEYTLEELQDATVYYRDLANKLADEMPRNEQGDLQYSSFAELAGQAGEGFDVLTYDQCYSVFAGATDPVKELGWADMYTSMGITGMTMPITGEAAVNPQTPSVGLPFTMCHEMAHRMCIAVERDANFAAYLACRANSSPEFQYSAYFMAYTYCYNALASVNSTEASIATARIAAGVNENFSHDLAAYSRFFRENYDENATNLANTVNDTYIKVSGDGSGISSYGEVCDLLVNLYIQEIILPAQKEDAKSTFDPYDENQVDLEGIVGALPKEDP
ncbi:MAG: DUF3810 domain-containing protein [Oscillospiraceae bacterium]|nr:DUF3810 domain-containing protein [Oscillospiraceae bacterium]